MARKDPLLSVKELSLGGAERNGPYVTLSCQRDVYIIYRQSALPAGQKVAASKTLRFARTIAGGMRMEKPK